jgi:hypothetical protein
VAAVGAVNSAVWVGGQVVGVAAFIAVSALAIIDAIARARNRPEREARTNLRREQ